MKQQLRIYACLCCALLLWSGQSHADEIQKLDGSVVPNATIEEATYSEVKYKLPGITVVQTLSTEEIESIQWRSVRSNVREGLGLLEGGKAKEAVEKLRTYGGQPVRKAADGFGHYLLGRARLALALADPGQLAEAVSTLKGSVDELQKAKKFNFYLPHCTALLGQAQIRSKQYDQAKKAYDSLKNYGKRWTVKAGLGGAKVSLAQGDAKSARSEFKRLMSSARDPQLKGEATVGYARSQLAQEQWTGAADTMRKELLKWTSNRGRNSESAPVRFNDLIVEGFIVLADAERGMKGKENLEWALLHYYRAEALATQGTELGAESLYKAAEVAKELGLDDQAASAMEELGTSYPNSSWSKK